MLEAIIARNPAEKTYVEDVFSTYLYTGTSAAQTINNGILLADGTIVSPESNSALPTINSDTYFESVAYGNGIFVAVARNVNAASSYGTTNYATSTDGINWTLRTSLPTGYWIKVLFDGTKFWALGGYISGWQLTQLVYSTDGLTWTSVSLPSGLQYYDSRDFSFINNPAGGAFNYFIVGSTVATGYRSVDGITWSTFTPYTDNSSTWTWKSFAWGGGTYIISSDSAGAYYSTNLSSWTSAGGPTSPISVVYLNGYFYMWNGSSLQRSSNGTSGSWTEVLAAYVTSMVYVNGRLLAFNRNDKKVYVSTTGASGSWTSYATSMSVSNQYPVMAATATGAVITSGGSGTARYAGVISSFTPAIQGKGGLVWIKARGNASSHDLFDTSRGAGKVLYTDGTAAQGTNGTTLTSFNTNGFSLGTDNTSQVNNSNWTYASWTFRKAPKFFDIVTYTGDGTTNRFLPHSLGVAPGFIIFKPTSTSGNWIVFAKSGTSFSRFYLNTTDAAPQSASWTNTTSATNIDLSTLDLYSDGGFGQTLNVLGQSYVAYLFAHDTTTDGLIQCGSFSAGATTNTPVSLGFEPQFLLVKKTNGSGNWFIWDNMREFRSGNSFNDYQYNSYINPNLTNAETNYISATEFAGPTQSGFNYYGSGGSYVYLAIRRGPMRRPTDATKVYGAVNRAGTGATATVTGTGFPIDLVLSKGRPQNGYPTAFFDRLRGPNAYLYSTSTDYENSAGRTDTLTGFDLQNGFTVGADSNQVVINYTLSTYYINYLFRRAPSFFDIVCYTGTGSARTVNHNLGVAPELMIVKKRSSADEWYVANSLQSPPALLFLNTNDSQTNAPSSAYFNSTSPTATNFSVGTYTGTNGSGERFVAYLFASCPGVSKVGTYTGTGTTQQINCGFSNGSRFVMIKRADSTSDWYIWDAYRGIISGNDPYILLNLTAGEVSNTDYIDPYAPGFEISSTAPAAINANGGSYIYLAIA